MRTKACWYIVHIISLFGVYVADDTTNGRAYVIWMVRYRFPSYQFHSTLRRVKSVVDRITHTTDSLREAVDNFAMAE